MLIVTGIDPRAATGFADSAAAYERARPTYPDEAIRMLAREFALTPRSVVLDLAAGTGKLTRVVAPYAARVIAVDPSEQMLAQLQAQLPDVEARLGAAEAIPVPDGSVDAVFVGQAFHWFDAPAALSEIARVLRPGGGLALLWNHSGGPESEDPQLAAVEALIEPYKTAAGGYPARDETWQQALADSGRFTALERAEFRHDQELTAEALATLVASRSWIANLPAAERAAVVDRVVAMAHGGVTVNYLTEVYWTRLVE